ncbi:MAG: metallophosphoesterase [Clostridia bacterium]|nr:metallophosphoesterase [Clostridia bacterium]
MHRYKGRNIVNSWSETDQFDITTIATVEKQKDKDFVILNLADVQICDLENPLIHLTIKREIEYLVQKTQPDLITLTGDQTWSNENLISLTELIRWLDSFKIPYAPVFGNHDYGNEKDSAVASQNYCCDLYERGKYSLFKRGPTNLGALGNYVLNIMEDGKIYKTLYMIDSGFEDKITDMQIAWFKWNADGIKTANNDVYSQSMVFLHKPLPEYAHAYYSLPYSQRTEINKYHHYSLSGSTQNGFFTAAKGAGVTNIVCGHQHGNNFTLQYEDVNLTFALKTGELVGYYSDEEVYMNGATSFILSGDHVEIINNFVDREQFHITKPINEE